MEQEPAAIVENGPHGHGFAYANLHKGFIRMLTTGNQLKAARALAGISQAQLAKAAEINVTTISAMEGNGGRGARQRARYHQGGDGRPGGGRR